MIHIISIKNIYILNNKMPQLVPFFFVNQVIFAFILLVLMIYIFSKYILPNRLQLFITRLFISKL
jgi:F-type H+-transporting ATPase subunit 8